jgi:SAM-dependent methyltransferase
VPDFAGILLKYLKYDETFTCIELGCIPGDFLVFLKKTFGYALYGIDYSDATEILDATMKRNGVSDLVFYNADVRTWTPPARFDIVCSFGLIEHFESTELIIEKHIEMLKDGGRLVLEVPNFRGCQYVLHLLLDRENLLRHNLGAMDPRHVNEILKRRGLNVEFSGYAGEFDFWVEPQRRNVLQRALIRAIRAARPAIKRITRGSSSRLFSSYVVWIATKRTWC